MTPLIETLLKAIASVIESIAGTVYDVAIYPGGLFVYNTLYHIPIVGPALCKGIDIILERFSQDWTTTGFGTGGSDNG